MDEKVMQPEAETEAAQEARVTVCDVQFRSGSKVYYFYPGDLTVKTGDEVIIDTARGAEFGRCTMGNHEVPGREVIAPLRPVLRLATEQDRRVQQENAEKEKKAFSICMQKIEERKLDMQLVSAEYAFDGSKLLFFFTSDGRVDFRELVKDLAAVFRTRIELRQIGVRDKAKMVGGLGICGRPFCCREFLDDFQPVSIKMAKTQNLSLNPTKISGTCGRLMCCLKYEQEAYEDLLRTSPKAESFVDTPDGRGTVTEVNLLRQSVKVRMEKQPDTCGCYKNCDICVLRNGKAKKTDPPIPDDLAPISGAPNRESKREESSLPPLEDVILKSAPPAPRREPTEKDAAPREEGKNRRSGRRERRPRSNAPVGEFRAAAERQIAEAAAQRAIFPEGQTEKSASSGRHRTKKRPGGAAKPTAEKAAGQESAAKAAAPKSAETAEPREGKKPNNRRRYYHRRSKGAPKSDG